jgi:hypothetical protein
MMKKFCEIKEITKEYIAVVRSKYNFTHKFIYEPEIQQWTKHKDYIKCEKL